MIERLEPPRLQPRVTSKHAGTFYALCGDERRLYAGSSDSTIHVFDPAGDLKRSVAQWKGHRNYVSTLALVDVGNARQLVSGSFDRSLIWWDVATGGSTRTIPAHDGWVRRVCSIGQIGQIASVGDDMLLKIWDAASGQLVRTCLGHAKRTPQGHVTALYALAASADGKQVASGDRIGDVVVWDVESGQAVSRFQVPVLYTYDATQRKRSIGGIRSLAFSADGASLAVGGIGRVDNVDGLGGLATVEVWDWRKPQRRAILKADGHNGMLKHLAFQGDWLVGAGGGDDGVIALWKTSDIPSVELAATAESAPVQTHRNKVDGHIHEFQFGKSGGELYAAGHETLAAWTVAWV